MNLDAKVSALIASSPDPVPGADSAADEETGAPPTGSTSSAESAAGALESVAGGSPAAPGASVAPTMADLFAEKLAKAKDARQAQRREHKARDRYADAERAAADAERAAAEAKADREVAAAERASLAEGRKDFRKFFEANGMNGREAYEEMTRQAIEADTPEAKLKAAQDAWKADLSETVEPLKRTIAELTEERERNKAGAAEGSFSNDFQRSVEDPAYEDLRIEYDDARLLDHARRFRDNPQFFYDVAKKHAVALTSPGDGFTMREILNTLRAVQAEHVAGSAKRRAAKSPPSSAEQAESSPTVNGTVERRSAGVTTIGNDLATARAADGKFVPQGKTAAQRVRERARRLSGG